MAMPKDANSQTMQLTYRMPALNSTYNTSVDSQVEITLQTASGTNPATSLIEVSAMNCPLLMKYKKVAGGTAVSTSSFDEFIGQGLTRHYRIPVGITVVAFIAQASGQSAILVCIEK